MTPLHSRLERFLDAVRRSCPADHGAATMVLNRLVDWSEQRGGLELLTTPNKKEIFSIRIRQDPHILWSARLFPTTGVWVTLLAWHHPLLGTPFELGIRDRVSALAGVDQLAPADELRVNVVDLTDPRRLADLLGILDELTDHLSNAA